LRQAVSLFAGDGVSAADRLRWSYMALWPTQLLWDDDGFRAILARHLQLVRNAGALDRLPIDLDSASHIASRGGDFGAAASLIAEANAAREATGAHIPAYAALLLACLRGRQADAVPLIDATINAAEAAGQGLTATHARWVTAILYNGLGRYEQAREAARQAAEDPSGFDVSLFALPELIEAAARSGNMPMAGDALQRLAGAAQASGTDFALGIEARSRALVAEDGTADDLYREAIDRLGRTQLRTELARAHLLYGEWLRRQGRRSDARERLRIAHTMLDEIGMEGFAERARRELAATGETARKRTTQAAADASQKLTAQEAQVAMLARDGLSNLEIGARVPGDERQRLCRRLVQPLRVVDHADQRSFLGEVRQQAQDRHADRERVWDIPAPHVECRVQRVTLRIGEMPKPVKERRAQLVEPGERHLRFRLGAGHPRDTAAGRALRQVIKQRGLAGSRLAAQDQDPALACPHIGDQPVQRLGLAATAIQPAPGCLFGGHGRQRGLDQVHHSVVVNARHDAHFLDPLAALRHQLVTRSAYSAGASSQVK
jgi:hypothetical protein